MIRKLLLAVEAMAVMAGFFFLNTLILGRQAALVDLTGHQQAVPDDGSLEGEGDSEHAGDASPVAVESLVALPAPFTADEFDRLARELMEERARLREEAEALTRQRKELNRLALDMRERRRAWRKGSDVDRNPLTPESRLTPTQVSESDPRRMAQIFDRMRPEAAASRLAALQPDLAARVLSRMTPKQAARSLGAMEPNLAAALAARIPGKRSSDL